VGKQPASALTADPIRGELKRPLWAIHGLPPSGHIQLDCFIGSF
jgi:hypothetical protein